jgi:hypothetical protein
MPQQDSKWISVKNEVPSTTEEVLAWAGILVIASCQREENGDRLWFHPLKQRITHWMPLPAPPLETL